MRGVERVESKRTASQYGGSNDIRRALPTPAARIDEWTAPRAKC
jgi:hypothetical protein